MEQTLQTKLDELKLNDIYWDRFTTILLHKRVSRQVIESFLYQLDAHLNGKIIGRQYHKGAHLSRRMLWWAVVEKTKTNGNHHIHLLSRTMDRERLTAFDKWMPELLEHLWDGSDWLIQSQAGDIEDDRRKTRAYIRNNNVWHPNFTMHDIEHIISYMLKETNHIIQCPKWNDQLAELDGTL